MKKLLRFYCTLLLSVVVFAGCGGDDGDNGLDGNTAPVANAGADQRVAEAGGFVNLSGSGSDRNGDSLTYVWAFTVKPVGSAAALSDSSLSKPTFTADKAGKYLLSLTVNDRQFDSVADTLTVWAGMPVPDTGQTRFYSTAFGDDGDYSINPMSYRDNYDGTVTDNVTGLTWQKCSIGQSGADCAGGSAAISNWYEASGTYDANYNPDTTDVCDPLGADWRLPKRMELLSLADYGVYIPAITGAYFPNTISSYYWSSSPYANTTYAWYVEFGYGYTSDYNKTGTFYVRCVRGE